MNAIQRSAARRVRAALVTAAVASMSGLLGTPAAQAETASRVASGAVVDSCAGVAGSITYVPGLRSTEVKAEHAVLTGTTSGCSDALSGPMSGTGTFSAILSGHASLGAENFSGTFTINWPVSSGFNPSHGALIVIDAGGMENVSGTVNSGVGTGALLDIQYATTGNTGKGTRKHPVTAQTFTNTQPLTLSIEEG